MGGNPTLKTSRQANEIAQASLNESQRQYNEQKSEDDAKKARAQANATAVRESGVTSYANNLQNSTNLNATNTNFSLLSTAGGTPSVLNTLMGGNNQKDNLGV